MSGKAYFIKSASYVRFDVSGDRVDDGYPKTMVGNWGGFSTVGFGGGVDTALNWAGGKVYFFRASNYIRYDIARNAVDEGYPLAIADHWSGLGDVGFGEDIDATVDLGNGSARFFKRAHASTVGILSQQWASTKEENPDGKHIPHPSGSRYRASWR